MKLKKIIFSPAATILAFVLAVALLLYSTIGGARAALTYVSENYTSQIQLLDIGVTLVENGKDVAWRNFNQEVTTREDWDEQTPDPGYLLNGMLPEARDGHTPQIVLDHPYKEEISVRNSGTINQYVRVTLYHYWVDADEEGTTAEDRLSRKRTDLDPAFIDLALTNLGSDWLLDESASTTERTVLYYNKLLNSGTSTAPLSSTLTIRSRYVDENGQTHSIKADPKTVTREDGTVITTYDYDGITFVLEARVDAVQQNNANAAIHSAWGRQVSVDEAAHTLAVG